MRGIFYFLWDFETESGALSVLRSFARAFRNSGIELDLCYLHSKTAGGFHKKIESDLFDRIFVPPVAVESCSEIEELIGKTFSDDTLSEMEVSPSRLYSGAQVIASGQYDFVGVHYTACHMIVDMLPKWLPKILFTYDLDSVVRQQKGNQLAHGDSYSIDDEIQRLKKFDLFTVLGPEDKKIVLDRDSRLQVIEASYCLDIKTIKKTNQQMETLAFVGSNAPFKRLSLQWFWKFVWPVLESLGFDGTLEIVGEISKCAVEFGMDKHPRCKIHGVVEDIDQYLLKSDLLVSPYYYGAGIKTVVLHAMSMGLPVITNKYGLTNTHLKHGHDVMVSDNGSEFAHMIMELKDFDLRDKLAKNALNTVRQWHSIDVGLKPIVQAVVSLVEQRKKELSVPSKSTSLIEGLRKRLPPILKRMRDQGVEKIAIYGAGTHTSTLLSVWRELAAPQVHCILLTEASETEFEGLPVVSIQDSTSLDIDAILGSSQSYEIPMALAANEYRPNTPFFHIWNPRFDISKHKRGLIKISISETIP